MKNKFFSGRERLVAAGAVYQLHMMLIQVLSSKTVSTRKMELLPNSNTHFTLDTFSNPGALQQERTFGHSWLPFKMIFLQ